MLDDPDAGPDGSDVMARETRDRPVRDRSIRVNFPGDGGWIAGRVGGEPFLEGLHHSLMSVRRVPIADIGVWMPVGGVVLCNYMGAGGSIVAHMAGEPGSGWLTRDLLWMMCDYVFNQLRCAKFIACVNSSRPEVVSIDLRAGFALEATIEHGFADGHMLFLTMTREGCPWLARPSPNYVVRPLEPLPDPTPDVARLVSEALDQLEQAATGTMH